MEVVLVVYRVKRFRNTCGRGLIVSVGSLGCTLTLTLSTRRLYAFNPLGTKVYLGSLRPEGPL